MGGRTLDQFRSIQRSKPKKTKDSEANKDTEQEESKQDYSPAQTRE